MTKTQPKSTPIEPESHLEEAMRIKRQVAEALAVAVDDGIPKLVEAYAKISNDVRQHEKQRKKDLEMFTDDEVIQYVLALPVRRRTAVQKAISGEDLSKKPLY